jgi:glycosyltransferase involved in cell wall biosynthesis
MIVKNEEENLSRCLDSVKGIPDEIILVDTGSADRTVSIALQYGAKVFRHPWNDSFSEARNFALSQASGTWILVMDADDELEAEDRDTLLHLTAESGDRDVYCCKTLSYSGNGADCGNVLVTMSVRLIRNGKGYFYRGRVHEQLAGPGGAPPLTATAIRFYHYGYLSSQLEKKEKHRRNIALISRELEDDPENGFMHFNLGNEYLATGAVRQAMDCYRASCRTLQPSLGYGSMLLTRMILCSEQLRDDESQCRYIRAGLHLYPQLPDFEYLKAGLLLRHGKVMRAIRSYQKCIRMGPPAADENSMLGVATFKPHDRLAALYEQLGERKTALRHCRKAIRFCSTDREAYARMIRMLGEEGCTPDRMKSRLLRMAKNEFCPILILSDLFYDRGFFRQAMELAKRAKRQAPDCPAACYNEGVCRFFLQQYQKAYRCLCAEPCIRTGGSVFFRFLCTLLDPGTARLCTEDFQAELEASDYRVCHAFYTLMQGKPCVLLPVKKEEEACCMDSVFGLLEVLLRAGLPTEFMKALMLLKLIPGDGVFLRLGKLYYKYGYEKLAYQQLDLSIRTAGKIDAESLFIMGRIRSAATADEAHSAGGRAM